MYKQEEGECCICLENYSNPHNLLINLPCTCKMLIHQECFIQTDLTKCLVCKKKYKLDNFSEFLKIYLSNNNLIQKILSISDSESDTKSDEETDIISQHRLDIELFDYHNETIINENRETSYKKFILSVVIRLLFIYLLGLIFGLIYCAINQFTYPQLIWYLHILMNLITGSIVFGILYFCCNQISLSLRNS